MYKDINPKKNSKIKNVYNNGIIQISNSKQIYSLSSSKIKNIKSFYFQNLTIDGNILKQIMSLGLDIVDDFYFIECYFKDLNILSTINYSKNLGFIKCGLYLEDFAYLFSWFKDWNNLETLDLSGNKLGIQQMEFFKWLNMNLWNKIYINKLILSDNNFSEIFEQRIISNNEWFKSFDEIIF